MCPQRRYYGEVSNSVTRMRVGGGQGATLAKAVLLYLTVLAHEEGGCW